MKTFNFWPVYVGGANSRPKKETKDEKIARIEVELLKLEKENESLKRKIQKLELAANLGNLYPNGDE